MILKLGRGTALCNMLKLMRCNKWANPLKACPLWQKHKAFRQAQRHLCMRKDGRVCARGKLVDMSDSERREFQVSCPEPVGEAGLWAGESQCWRCMSSYVYSKFSRDYGARTAGLLVEYASLPVTLLWGEFIVVFKTKATSSACMLSAVCLYATSHLHSTLIFFQ